MELKRRARNPDDYVICNQPRFIAREALSDSVTDSTIGGDEDATDDGFEKFESDAWSTALSKSVPNITAEAWSAPKPHASLGAVGGRARKAKKNAGGVVTNPVANAATSSGNCNSLAQTIFPGANTLVALRVACRPPLAIESLRATKRNFRV